MEYDGVAPEAKNKRVEDRWCSGVVERHDAHCGVRESNPSEAAAANTGGEVHPRHLNWLKTCKHHHYHKVIADC